MLLYFFSKGITIYIFKHLNKFFVVLKHSLIQIKLDNHEQSQNINLDHDSSNFYKRSPCTLLSDDIYKMVQ